MVVPVVVARVTGRVLKSMKYGAVVTWLAAPTIFRQILYIYYATFCM